MTVESIKWNEIKKRYPCRNNLMMTKPTPKMALLPSGETREHTFNVYTTQDGWHQRLLAVNYDRDYVIEWLRHQLGTLRGSMKYNDFQKLLSDAFPGERRDYRANKLANAPLKIESTPKTKGRSVD